MLKKIIGKLFLVYAVVTAIFFSIVLFGDNTKEAFAITDDNCRLKSENGQFSGRANDVSEAVKWACGKISGGSSSRWGVVWFNSEAGTAADKQDYVIKAEYIRESDKSDDNSGLYIPAYLHGQYYSGGHGTDRTRSSMSAWGIRFVKPEKYKETSDENDNGEAVAIDVFYYYNTENGVTTCKRYTGRQDGKTYCHPDDTVDFINDIYDKVLVRGADGFSANTGSYIQNYTWSKSGEPIELQLDVDKMKGSKYCTYDAETNTNTCEVGMYRCPKSTSSASSTCGTDNGTMIIQGYGLTKGRIKLKTGPKGESTTNNAVAVTYDGDFQDYEFHEHDAMASFTDSPANIGTVHFQHFPQATYTVKLEPGQQLKFNFHTLLKKTIDTVKGEYTICYQNAPNNDAKNCKKALQSLSPSDLSSSSEVDTLKVYAVVDNSGKVSFEDGGSSTNELLPSKDNTFCYTLMYKRLDDDLVPTEARSVCVKVDAGLPTYPQVQGKITMNAAVDPSSAGSSNTSTAAANALISATGSVTAGYDNGSSASKSLSTTIDGDGTIDTYAQWKFDANVTGVSGKFQYKIISCTDSNNKCENWIKKLKVSEYSSQTVGDAAKNSSGQSVENTKIYFKKETTTRDSYSGEKTISYRTSSNAPEEYNDVLRKNGKFTVCYKLFVANVITTVNDDDAWNTSYACAKFTAGGGTDDNGSIHGKTRFVYSRADGNCSVSEGGTNLYNASASNNGGLLRVDREISAENNDLPTIITLSCPSGVTSVGISFLHEIWSDDEVSPSVFQAKNRVGSGQNPDYTDYSQLNAFYNKNGSSKIPTTRSKVDSVIIKSKKSGNSYTSGNGELDGKYNLEMEHYVCEGLFGPSDKNAVVCVYLLPDDIPNPAGIMGRSRVEVSIPSGCTADGDSIEQTLRKGNAALGSYPTITIKCENVTNPAATVKFSHYSSRGQGISDAARHRVFHNDNPDEGSVGPTIDHTHNANSPFNHNPLYSNSNGQYTVHEGGTICESQWFFEGRSNALVAGVCVKLESTTPTCPGGPTTSTNDTASGTSYLLVSVKNVRTGKMETTNTYTYPNASSTSTILAKPTDEIVFNHCYYTGAQSVRTTEYWDKIKQETPTKPSTKSACKMTYKQGETAPTECTTKPTYNLSPKSTTCTNGDWTNCDGASGSSYNNYTVDTSKKETLHEANYDKISVDNDKYNSYGVGTTYPNTHTELGNGVYDGSSSSISDSYTGSGYVAMQYTGEGFSGNTGTSGEIHTGIAQNMYHTFVTVGAPGGYLKQSASAYVGKVARKQHNQTWSWGIGYNFTPCMFKKKKGSDGKYLDPVEYEDTCTEQALKSVSSTSSGKGTGSGDHGSIYYERDTSATDYASKTLSTAVYVPYNYTSSALVEIGDDKIYAGEQFTLKNAFVYIEPTNHSYLSSSYATIAPDISVELYAYISDDDQTNSVAEYRTSGELKGCDHYRTNNLECAKIDYTTKTFNQKGKLNGTKNENREYAFNSRKYNAFDYIAGRYLCVGIGFNKSTTTAYNYATDGSEINTNSIYYSAPSCKQIYKKPTFAVWGGSVFSNGDVDVNKMEKRNVANYNSYQSQGTLYRVTFSPWVEGIVVANGSVRALASGASTAYTFAGDASTNYEPAAAPGGFGGNDYCNMSPLTIANESCSGGETGNADQDNRTGVKNEIIRRYIEPYFDFDTNTQKTNSDCGSNGRNKCFSPSDSAFTNSQIGYTDVEYGKTYIFASKNDITINSDILYKDSYVSSNQVSQVIIYSKGNINIVGGVSRIDAVLIAEGRVNTCSTDTATCHGQLRINGSIIANKVELNRLYGASVGSYSVEPAEIINFSPTIFLWSSVEGSNKLNEDLIETYTRELAPRQ